MAVLLLIFAIGALIWFVKGDFAEYRRFRRLQDTRSRLMRYRLWIAKAVIAFMLPAVIGLALLGRLDALTAMPPEFRSMRAMLPAFQGDASGFLVGVLAGGAIGGMLVGVMIAVRGRRALPKPLGDVGSLLPRNRAELAHAAALSVSAGVTEEIAFRLFLPLLVALVTGSAALAFGVAAAVFGAMHLYQGWIGVVATTVVGLVMTFVYVVTGALWLAMLLHALIDLNGFVLRPALTGAWRA